MSSAVVIVDLFGLILAAIGFTMAFRQRTVRRILGRPIRPAARKDEDEEDPLTYGLRISGVMIMVFGIVIAGMVMFIHLR